MERLSDLMTPVTRTSQAPLADNLSSVMNET
jgi:hypothetical protein